jgi:hypothetical protein
MAPPPLSMIVAPAEERILLLWFLILGFDPSPPWSPTNFSKEFQEKTKKERAIASNNI